GPSWIRMGSKMVFRAQLVQWENSRIIKAGGPGSIPGLRMLFHGAVCDPAGGSPLPTLFLRKRSPQSFLWFGRPRVALRVLLLHRLAVFPLPSLAL
ncbi:hypothetical protein TcG_09980, partial [Trypanosoma cruzi]